MKTALTVAGIVILVLCVLSFLLAVFFRSGYYGLMDGSPEQYRVLKRRMTATFVAGVALAAAGAACLIIRFNI